MRVTCTWQNSQNEIWDVNNSEIWLNQHLDLFFFLLISFLMSGNSSQQTPQWFNVQHFLGEMRRWIVAEGVRCGWRDGRTQLKRHEWGLLAPASHHPIANPCSSFHQGTHWISLIRFSCHQGTHWSVYLGRRCVSCLQEIHWISSLGMMGHFVSFLRETRLTSWWCPVFFLREIHWISCQGNCCVFCRQEIHWSACVFHPRTRCSVCWGHFHWGTNHNRWPMGLHMLIGTALKRHNAVDSEKQWVTIAVYHSIMYQ